MKSFRGCWYSEVGQVTTGAIIRSYYIWFAVAVKIAGGNQTCTFKKTYPRLLSFKLGIEPKGILRSPKFL